MIKQGDINQQLSVDNLKKQAVTDVCKLAREMHSHHVSITKAHVTDSPETLYVCAHINRYKIILDNLSQCHLISNSKRDS